MLCTTVVCCKIRNYRANQTVWTVRRRLNLVIWRLMIRSMIWRLFPGLFRVIGLFCFCIFFIRIWQDNIGFICCWKFFRGTRFEVIVIILIAPQIWLTISNFIESSANFWCASCRRRKFSFPWIIKEMNRNFRISEQLIIFCLLIFILVVFFKALIDQWIELTSTENCFILDKTGQNKSISIQNIKSSPYYQ